MTTSYEIIFGTYETFCQISGLRFRQVDFLEGCPPWTKCFVTTMSSVSCIIRATLIAQFEDKVTLSDVRPADYLSRGFRVKLSRASAFVTHT